MPSEPIVTPLPRSHRRLVFWSFLTIFIIAMPTLWFYTTGYRFDWTKEEGNIVGVGGLYISTDASNVQFFVDDLQVTNFRIFRKAAYIQNLVEGTHSIHVQGDGLQTWTKDLSVQSYIVTEAFAFLMPSTPRIRVIGEFETATGTAVLKMPPGTASQFFTFASTTNSYIGTTSRATSTLVQNIEYRYVKDLFASSTATSTSIVSQISDRIEQLANLTDSATSSQSDAATTTRTNGEVMLSLIDGEVNISWVGQERDRPHYYCIDTVSSSTTPKNEGTHVYEDIVAEGMKHLASTTQAVQALLEGTRACRESIRIDRKEKLVKDFEIFPGASGLVLMLLEDGLYVVEADDRAWQNTQRLYPGTDLAFVVDGGRIYVRDRDIYLEVFTTTQ